ncbi:MAG: peptidoglycan DD-metalloendopeptidase family protein [Rhodoferax sp.]
MVCAALAALLGACSSTALRKAPVEERAAPVPATAPAVIRAPEAPEAPVRPVAPTSSAPADSTAYYTVKPGDSLIRIALEFGRTVADLSTWNALVNPNHIVVGQVLRVAPPAPGATAPSAAVGVEVSPVRKPVIVAQPGAAVVAQPAGSAPAKASSAPSSAPVSPSAAASAPAPEPKPVAGGESIDWIWPAAGPVLAGFNEVKNKGVDIGGSAGDAVVAAADGRVVYVGAGLRGYGNLIILKHNNVYLTAYAHNQKLLVKEDQNVKKGQKIAEMGSSDADRVKLHFEVRKQGKPVDPAHYLPAR